MIFDSTIAFTIYNLLCTRNGFAVKPLLLQAARTLQHPELEEEQFERALTGLVMRGIVTVNGDQVKAVDPDLRVLVSRSLADIDAGIVEGGWKGWVVRDHSGGSNKLRTLDIVLEEVKGS